MKYRSFGIAAKQQLDAQLDLFAPVPDYVLGPKVVHDFSGDVSWTATWKGEYAGGINPSVEFPGKFQAWADLGWALYRNGASSHFNCLGEFDTLEEAAAAHERRAREVRADNTLIWTLQRTKENIRKSKARGWWNKDDAA